MNQDNQNNDLVETPLFQLTPIWDAIYNHVYPDLKNEYEEHERNHISAMFQPPDPDVLTEEEHLASQVDEMAYFTSEMVRVLQVRALLRRLAGYRH